MVLLRTLDFRTLSRRLRPDVAEIRTSGMCFEEAEIMVFEQASPLRSNIQDM